MKNMCSVTQRSQGFCPASITIPQRRTNPTPSARCHHRLPPSDLIPLHLTQYQHQVNRQTSTLPDRQRDREGQRQRERDRDRRPPAAVSASNVSNACIQAVSTSTQPARTTTTLTAWLGHAWQTLAAGFDLPFPANTIWQALGLWLLSPGPARWSHYSGLQ